MKKKPLQLAKHVPSTVWMTSDYTPVDDINTPISNSKININTAYYIPKRIKLGYIKQYTICDYTTGITTKYIPVITTSRGWRYNRDMLFKLADRNDTAITSILFNERFLFTAKTCLGKHFHAVMRDVCKKAKMPYKAIMHYFNNHYRSDPNIKLVNSIEKILITKWSNVFNILGITTNKVELKLDADGYYSVSVMYVPDTLPDEFSECRIIFILNRSFKCGKFDPFIRVSFSSLYFAKYKSSEYKRLDKDEYQTYHIDTVCNALLPELESVVKMFSLAC